MPGKGDNVSKENAKSAKGSAKIARGKRGSKETLLQCTKARRASSGIEKRAIEGALVICFPLA